MIIKKSLLVLFTITLISSLGLTGCANDLDADTYSRDQVRQVATVETGTIKSLKLVKISGEENWIGGGTSAVLGGAAGSLAGGGNGHIVSAVIGAVAGGLLGEITQEGLTKAKGVEITIQKNTGQEISIVQQVEQDQVFRVGDKVRILQEGNTTRVELDQ